MDTLIKSLERGICPPELDYTSGQSQEIDWDKVRYNTFYHQPEFFENKFPPECKNLPSFDKIINLMVRKNENNSPLKEITKLSQDSICLDPTEDTSMTQHISQR